MSDIVERFTEISRRDDCFDHMVPSDVRQMLGDITRLRAQIPDRDALETVLQALEGMDNYYWTKELNAAIAKVKETLT